MAVVEFVGAAIPVPGFAEHENIVAATEGVGVNRDGAKVDVGILARSLAGRRAIEIPFGELVGALDRLVERLCDVKD